MSQRHCFVVLLWSHLNQSTGGRCACRMTQLCPISLLPRPPWSLYLQPRSRHIESPETGPCHLTSPENVLCLLSSLCFLWLLLPCTRIINSFLGTDSMWSLTSTPKHQFVGFFSCPGGHLKAYQILLNYFHLFYCKFFLLILPRVNLRKFPKYHIH